MRKTIFTALLIASVAAMAVIFNAPTKAAGTNLIANPSLENMNANNKPRKWQTDVWGTNTATFSYLNTGHTGTRSVKTEVTSWTDGDAKWAFTPVAVTGGQTYTFSDFYQSSVETQIVVEYTHTDGSLSYEWVGSAAPNASWAQASYSFDVPADANKVSVFHLVASVGWLVLDDASLTVAQTPPPPVPDGNIVANPSVETSGDAVNPDSWAHNNWGTNTANFSYLPTGHTGGHSVKTEVTSWTDGDAKWYFQPATVTGSTAYTFSDYYQSNVQTQAVVQYTHTNDTLSYELLGQTPASAGWQQAYFTFTTPSDVKSATVFHIVSSVGWLTLDDAFVAKAQTTAGLIPNSSFEAPVSGNPNAPDKWQSNSWGSNTTSFEYSQEGHTGSRSAKITMGNYVDGDAKWYYAPQTNLTPGTTYRFNAWYRGTALPHPTVMYTKADGTTGYLAMPLPDPAADPNAWQKFSDTFTVPTGAKDVSIFLHVAQNGWLQTDDYSIEPYQAAGFSRPLVTLTFDDGHEVNTANALPVMTARNLVSTQCYATQPIEGNQTAINNVLAFKNAGHEICSHTVTHPFLTQLPTAQMQYELSHSKTFLESITGAPITSFASPYGDYNADVINQIKPLYRTHRTVDEGYNAKDNFNIYKLRVQNMLSSTTLAEYQSWLAHAQATNTWLILVYHAIPTDNPGPYDTKQSDFVSQMDALQASGLTVKTYNAALDEVVPQL